MCYMALDNRYIPPSEGTCQDLLTQKGLDAPHTQSDVFFLLWGFRAPMPGAKAWIVGSATGFSNSEASPPVGSWLPFHFPQCASWPCSGTLSHRGEGWSGPLSSFIQRMKEIHWQPV